MFEINLFWPCGFHLVIRFPWILDKQIFEDWRKGTENCAQVVVFGKQARHGVLPNQLWTQERKPHNTPETGSAVKKCGSDWR